MCVFLYPMTASWFAQYRQSKVIVNYVGQVADPSQRSLVAKELADAHRYNDELASQAAVRPGQWPSTSDKTSVTDLDYDKLLCVGPSCMMGEITVPSIKVDLPIYHGTADETLLKGVGHLEGTSLPVGGAGTHAVLTGHRGLASATLFTNLDRVAVGDSFSITVLNQELAYKVISITVVDPDQTQSLKAVPGKDLVSLVTCTPLGINTQRIIVTGERVPSVAAQFAPRHRGIALPGFPGGPSSPAAVRRWPCSICGIPPARNTAGRGVPLEPQGFVNTPCVRLSLLVDGAVATDGVRKIGRNFSPRGVSIPLCRYENTQSSTRRCRI